MLVLDLQGAYVLPGAVHFDLAAAPG